jgi:hypothetical protein
MPTENIIINFITTGIEKLQANIKGFNNVMKQDMEQFRRNTVAVGQQVNVGAKLASRFREITHGLRGFRMEMLGVMFFGLGLSAFFKGLLQPALDLVGAFDILNITLAVGLLPTALWLLDVFLKIMDWFLGLPEPVRILIGQIILFGTALTTLLFAVGMFSLGLGSLAVMLGNFGIALLPLLGWIGAIGVAIIGIIWIWKNWEKITTQFKVALVVLGVAIGTILLLLGLTVGWIFIIVAAVIGIIAVIKNWTAIIEFFKEVWTKVWTAVKDFFIGIFEGIKSFFIGVINWIIDKLNWLIGVYNRIATKLHLPTIGEIGAIGGMQFGGVVPQEGLYHLHKGETVVPSTQSLFFSPNVYINTTGSVDINNIKSSLNESWANELGRMARR